MPNGKIFEPVKWIFKTAKNEPHKTSLRELINVVTGKAPNQKIIDSCFTDEKGKKIQLAKPKKEANTDYWTDKFKAMIN